jgi:hypothetical protein
MDQISTVDVVLTLLTTRRGVDGDDHGMPTESAPRPLIRRFSFLQFVSLLPGIADRQMIV